jgi:hypothetical protein
MPRRKYVMDMPDNWMELAALQELKERYPERNTDLVNVISAGASSSEDTPGSGGANGEEGEVVIGKRRRRKWGRKRPTEALTTSKA